MRNRTHSFCCMSHMNRYWAIGLAVATLSQIPAIAGELGAAGGDRIVWAFAEFPTGEGVVGVWRFAFCRSEFDREAGWRHSFRFGQAVGELRAAAVRGDRLHVFFDDGSHQIYGLGRSRPGSNLPRSAVPTALCGDDAADALYVLVPKHVGESLAVQRSPAGDETESESGAITEGEAAGEPAAKELIEPESADPWADSKFVFLRSDGGGWQGDRGLPEWFDQPDDVWLTASNGAIEMVFCPQGGEGSGRASAGYRFSSSPAVDDAWSDPEVIDGLAPGSLLDVLNVEGAPLLIVSRDNSAVATLRRRTDGWVSGGTLRVDGAVWAPPAVDTAFGAFGEHLVGVWLSDDGKFRSAEWNPANDEAIGGAVILRGLSPGESPQGVGKSRRTVAYGFLIGVLVVVFLRRRGSIITAAGLKTNQRLVGHGRRLLAFCLDGLLFSPFVGFVFAPWSRHFDMSMDLTAQTEVLDAAAWNEFTWRWVLAVFLFAAYACVFEVWWQATPGKRILGCRVVTEHGERCRLLQVILRNVLRCVELFPFFELVSTLVLVLLTRNRQRLGDLISGTIVVRELQGEAPKAK